MAWSRTLGLLTVLVVVPILWRRGPWPALPSGSILRSAIRPGLVLGGLMFVGYFLQTEGQARTTATNAGFITGMYVVFVPILAAMVFRRPVPGAAWVAVLVSMVGLALLSVSNLDDVRVHAGDLFVLAGAAAWAGHILAVGHYAPSLPPWVLSVAQLGVAAMLHVAAASGTGIRLEETLRGDVLPLLVVTGVLGTGVAFTIQLVAQQTLTATRAVILLAGESLFAALFAALWIDERLDLHQWAGAALVVGAMIYSELGGRRVRAPTGVDPAAVP
jgi:drug/metabolite transporter (DMT)-like permease